MRGFAVSVCLFWLAVVGAGYPLPHVDDLFFTGVATTLARDGRLANPQLSEWAAGMGTETFYFYTPFHPYALAAWLDLAGVSTGSMLAFQLACYVAASLFAAATLRRLGSPRWVWALVVAVLAAWHCNPNGGTGLRPDAFGVAVFAAGLDALTRMRPCSPFAGVGAIAIGTVAAPALVSYAVPLGFAAMVGAYRDARARGTAGPWRRRAVAGSGLALATVAVAFLWCIGFEARGFVDAFSRHAAMRRASVVDALPHFRRS